ncbi:uncharacterized protein LOC128389774 [Panonychus citri]|uniref:uncharacterized protein LOC128389774 n=1 Tax=Panonychus citri TaxID=50023 RepID=UPI0023072D6C|nr:uncharacterized protein LOC128389774 [Panonychus citri]
MSCGEPASKSDSVEIRVTPPCKFHEQGCNGNAIFKCSCIPDGFLCNLHLLEIHSRILTTPCTPLQLVRGHEKLTLKPCDECKKFRSEFITHENKHLCYYCSKNSNVIMKVEEKALKSMIEKAERVKNIIQCKISKAISVTNDVSSIIAEEDEKINQVVKKIRENHDAFIEFHMNMKDMYDEERKIAENAITNLTSETGNLIEIFRSLTTEKVKLLDFKSVENLFDRYMGSLPSWPVTRQKFMFTDAEGKPIDGYGQRVMITYPAEFGDSDSTEIDDTNVDVEAVETTVDKNTKTHEPVPVKSRIIMNLESTRPSSRATESSCSSEPVASTSKQHAQDHEHDPISKTFDLTPHPNQNFAHSIVTRVISPFHVCMTIPEFTEKRIEIIDYIDKHSEMWQPVLHLYVGANVIVQDPGMNTKPYKRAKVKYINYEDGSVKVNLLDYGFDIVKKDMDIGYLVGKHPKMPTQEYAFRAKLIGIKPLSNFSFPSTVKRCGTSFLNSLIEKHGALVHVSRIACDQESFMFCHIKSKFDGQEHDWSNMLLERGMAIEYTANNGCYLPDRNYCHLFHSGASCRGSCWRVHDCPFCWEQHSLKYCKKFADKVNS